MKFLREPLVHFMLIGAAIYGSYALVAEPQVAEDENRIVVTTGEVQWMKASWQKRWNRPPTEQEFDGMISQYIRDTILYKEALNMGLDQNDTVIKKRLAQKVEFIAKDLASYVEPTEQELQSYLSENIETYRAPATYTFTQIFIDPDKRGDKTLNDAENIKASLIKNKVNIEQVSSYSDALMTDNYYRNLTIREMRRTFGSGFTESLIALKPGEWHGPVLSGFGVHLVYIEKSTHAADPILADVKERVMQDWYDLKREQLNEQFYSALRERYEVVIEDDNSSKLQSSAKNTVEVTELVQQPVQEPNS